MTRFICAKKPIFYPTLFCKTADDIRQDNSSLTKYCFPSGGEEGGGGVTHKKTKVEDRAKNRIIEGHRFKDESSRKKQDIGI